MITYIGLGSNLGEPLLQLQQALETLHNDIELRLLKVSSFYQSKALTLPDTVLQSDYVNAVSMLETALSAEEMLLKLNAIEVLQGRERKEKWAARTLDLDILLFGEFRIQTDTLQIPHTQIEFRNFVIHPLFEIAGAIDLPGLGDLSVLANKTNWHGLQKMECQDNKKTTQKIWQEHEKNNHNSAQ